MTLSSEYVQTIRSLPAVSAAAAPSQAPGPQGRPGSFSPCEHFFPEQPWHPLKMKIGAGTCPARTLAASHQGESWSPFSGLCGWAPSSASSALGPLVGSLRASPDCRLAPSAHALPPGRCSTGYRLARVHLELLYWYGCKQGSSSVFPHMDDSCHSSSSRTDPPPPCRRFG